MAENLRFYPNQITNSKLGQADGRAARVSENRAAWNRAAIAHCRTAVLGGTSPPMSQFRPSGRRLPLLSQSPLPKVSGGRPSLLARGSPKRTAPGRYYLHVLGTDPEKDQAVFGYGVVPSIDVNPRQFASIRTQPDSKFALGVIGTPVISPNSAFYIAPVDTIGKSNALWRKVADFSDDVADIAVHGDDLYLLTYKNAPRYKIIRMDARKPDLSSAETIVAPGEAVIQGMASAQDALYALVRTHAMPRARSRCIHATNS
jgi:hypothetical protein